MHDAIQDGINGISTINLPRLEPKNTEQRLQKHQKRRANLAEPGKERWRFVFTHNPYRKNARSRHLGSPILRAARNVN